MEGYVHVYTGNGKGKTTAALGLALRAVGAGQRVFIAQFIKGMPYSELEAIKRIPEISLRQFGRGCFLGREVAEEDRQAAREGLQAVREILQDPCPYGLVILDEACVAHHFGLLSMEDLNAVLDRRPPGVELVLTGRYAPQALLDRADLVTEMREIKHYYTRGIQARTGVEK